MKKLLLGVSLLTSTHAYLNSHVYADPTSTSDLQPLHVTKATYYEARTLNPSVLGPVKRLENSTNDLIHELQESSKALSEVVERDAFKYNFNEPITFELTAYTLAPEENGWFGTISSAQYDLSNKYLKDRYIAVDPRIIPYHTKVYIEFPEERRYVEQHGEMVDLNGEYLAVDCGSAIQSRKIDLFVGGMSSYYENIANKIGRGYVNVYYPLSS